MKPSPKSKVQSPRSKGGRRPWTWGLGMAALVLGGCWYDRPNPYDTSDMVEEHQERKEAIWQMEAGAEYRHPPQQEPSRLEDPDLEGWRDTVLKTADVSTLRQIRTWTLAKVADLERRRAALLRQYEPNRIDALRVVERELRVERRRLAMLDEAPSGRP